MWKTTPNASDRPRNGATWRSAPCSRLVGIKLNRDPQEEFPSDEETGEPGSNLAKRKFALQAKAVRGGTHFSAASLLEHTYRRAAEVQRA